MNARMVHSMATTIAYGPNKNATSVGFVRDKLMIMKHVVIQHKRRTSAKIERPRGDREIENRLRVQTEG